MFKDSLTTEEWRTLQFGPLWVFGIVAAIDSKIETKEVAALAKELAEAGLYKEPLAAEVYGSVSSDFANVMQLFTADARDPLRGLSEVANLLDQKVTPDHANGFKRALMLLGHNVAIATGGRITRRKKVGKKEGVALVAIFTTLRVTA